MVVALEPGPCFEYRAQDLAIGLVEHEIDQLFWCHVGVIELQPDPRETDAWCWVDRHELQTWMQREPASFTPWFAPLLEQADGLWR